MAHEWNKVSKTYDWDNIAFENPSEPVPTPLYMMRGDRMTVAEDYNTTSGHEFLWRREVHYLDGAGGIVYISSVDVRITRTSTTETLEQRREDYGDWEVGWVRDLTVDPPTGNFTYTTAFEYEMTPGTRELWETYSVDGVPGTAYMVGRFDVRSLVITNIRSEKYLFNPLKEGTVIKADVVALPAPNDSFLFPGGWTPLGSIPYRYEMVRNTFLLPSGNGVVAQTPLVPETGRVAEISFPWNGKTLDNKRVNGLVKIEMKSLMDVPGPGNVFSQGEGSTFPFMRRCDDKCTRRNGELSFEVPLSSPGHTMDLSLSYLSSGLSAEPASMGYGWRSTGSATIEEDLDGAVIYVTESDIVMRWEPDGLGGYVAINGDNYSRLEKLGSSHFRVTFPNSAQREFLSGKPSSDIDRHGNSITYTYNGAGHLSLIEDSGGHKVYYSYSDTHGTRTDGQPVSIRFDDPVNGREYRLEYYSSSHLDSPNRLAKVIDPMGQATEFEYLPSGPITKIIERRPNKGDHVVEYFYNGSFRPGRQLVNGTLETLYGYMQMFRPYDPVNYDVTRVEVRDLTLAEPHLSPLRETMYYYEPEGRLVRIEDGVPLYLEI